MPDEPVPDEPVLLCPKCSRKFDTPNALGFHVSFRDTPKMSSCEAANAIEARQARKPKMVEP